MEEANKQHGQWSIQWTSDGTKLVSGTNKQLYTVAYPSGVTKRAAITKIKIITIKNKKSRSLALTKWSNIMLTKNETEEI
jgi:hypothetical protein